MNYTITRPRALTQAWLAIAFFLGSVSTAKADGAPWTDPNVVLSIIGIVVSAGMAYQMLQDVKARMLVLEQQAASKETVAAVTARLDRIEKKLDTLLMERATHGE
jgi:hypothetical protein